LPPILAAGQAMMRLVLSPLPAPLLLYLGGRITRTCAYIPRSLSSAPAPCSLARSHLPYHADDVVASIRCGVPEYGALVCANERRAVRCACFGRDRVRIALL